MYDEWLAVLRFLHIIAGITWIGLLYYFNLVQGQAFGKMEAPARMNAVQHLASRALFFFRWAALATVVFGILWIVVREAQLQNDFDTSYYDTDAFKSIAVGGGIGIIMLLNVWGVIWPNQKKIIAATTATATQGAAAPPDQAKWARMAFLASRTNVMLSIPMLFFMVASGHLSSIWS
ncbi:MAG: hypothetical protein EXR43_01065 [Dehalococcoidia bacterium]|nr:hypothetical protein [Dehalococcoidia bacterium]